MSSGEKIQIVVKFKKENDIVNKRVPGVGGLIWTMNWSLHGLEFWNTVFSNSVGKLPQTWFVNKRTMSVKHGSCIGSRIVFSLAGVKIWFLQALSQLNPEGGHRGSTLAIVPTHPSLWLLAQSGHMLCLENSIYCTVSLMVLHFPPCLHNAATSTFW